MNPLMDCDCVESCQLADRFTPATRELMVFTKSAKRYFDLDSVREPYAPLTMRIKGEAWARGERGFKTGPKAASGETGRPMPESRATHAGAPPLDWWKIDPDIPYTPQLEGEQMPATFYVGDAIEVMGKLPENSVDLILTSPPFLALRSYLPADHESKALEGGSQSTPGEFIDWLIDVVEACDRVLAPHGSLCIELGDTYAGGGGSSMMDGRLADPEDETRTRANPRGSPSGRLANYSDDRGNPDGMRDTTFSGGNTRTGGGTGWPLAKSLSLIPELFRLTLVYGFNPLTGRQTERWRLRNVVRWVRPNPPVGALGDKFRPATSELMVFCKSAKRYFDLDAVREPYSPASLQRAQSDAPGHIGVRQADGGRRNDQPTMAIEYKLTQAGAPPLDWWNIPLLEGEEETRYGKQEASKEAKPRNRQAEPAMSRGGNWNTFPNVESSNPLGAPPLDWWNIPPGGYEGAHYAVFPPELCVKPVKAMCPEKVCRVCGEPSRRIVGEAEYLKPDGRKHSELDMRVGTRAAPGVNQWLNPGHDTGNMTRVAPTLGWTDCGHSGPCDNCKGKGHYVVASTRGQHETDDLQCPVCDGLGSVNNWRPGLVLDPFGGSGTTALVATGHGRDCILIDLDERNYELALERVGPFILSLGNFDD